ncbi:TnpV protein [Christensenellaceae bacterium OttesenSCG-928-K19]|nr:TnpV protein [Christensenellaceae bacterium OttesenSCG-928-K19]
MLNLTYTQGEDGILYPDLTMDAKAEMLTKYGRMRKTFLKNHRNSLYTSLLTEGILDKHCREIQEQAETRKDVIMARLKKQTPPPRTEDFLAVVRYNNQINDQAEEIVLNEIVYNLTN